MSNIDKQKKGSTSREGEPDVSPSPATIWEVIDEAMSDVPDEILNRLPTEPGKARRHFGAWDSGDERSADNDRIDRGLASDAD